ncbi:hypothetical protein [Peribacillus cavernae]|uniref:hypothetical protein n=1 Tax=Peribacillus cavernae TaxID=1674310 RepID=UPI00163BCD35|nr:hypothetical protein [Peribacillus cavernae]MDQ0220687.1 hypothetical protein [Peribacillus cavernae]
MEIEVQDIESVFHITEPWYIEEVILDYYTGAMEVKGQKYCEEVRGRVDQGDQVGTVE